jgi:hypothetical protein
MHVNLAKIKGLDVASVQQSHAATEATARSGPTLEEEDPMHAYLAAEAARKRAKKERKKEKKEKKKKCKMAERAGAAVSSSSSDSDDDGGAARVPAAGAPVPHSEAAAQRRSRFDQ